MSKTDFKKLIQDQRKNKKAKKFTGTFLDYLSLLENGDTKVRLAHKRLYDSIVKSGIETLDENDPRCRKLFGGEKTSVYSYFKDQFFGMENFATNITHKL